MVNSNIVNQYKLHQLLNQPERGERNDLQDHSYGYNYSYTQPVPIIPFAPISAIFFGNSGWEWITSALELIVNIREEGMPTDL
jgi:hypothetical protein